ncbi:MAG: phosphatidylserine decarboxylase family protein [Saprospiraceae bacterium]|nr:phosphatidylserine decarboxylase family protein [Saprospiraceae bacterium]
MDIHKEGKNWVFGFLLFYVGMVLLLSWNDSFLAIPISLILGVFFLLILNFFRNPDRPIYSKDDRILYSPADGKIVVIEKTYEDEYFKDEKIQISIFMNPLNVHVNRYPVSGTVMYSKYHPGKYLVAWHPKASKENERTTVVLRRKDGKEILIRQIAGAVARRICNYAQEGQAVEQGEDQGFIKFGSRVDLFLPLNSSIKVEMNQIVKGNIDEIAHLD